MMRSLFFFLGLATLPALADGKIRVVATVPNLASICEAVGGDRVEVFTLAAGNQDAHFVDPKPSYMVKLRDADLLLVNGLDLEIGWVPPITEGARNNRLLRGNAGYVDCSAGIAALEVPAGGVTRAEGDVHPFGNPHYLTDPGNARIVAATIADALARVSPKDAERFETGKKAFVRRLDEAMFGAPLVDAVGGTKLWRLLDAGQLDKFLADQGGGLALGGWAARMKPLQGRSIVTYHKDYTYFARRFGIGVVDYVEPKPGIPPSARHLVELIHRVERERIPLVVTRPWFESRATDLLASKTGLKVLDLPLECGMEGMPDYITLYDKVTQSLADAVR